MEKQTCRMCDFVADLSLGYGVALQTTLDRMLDHVLQELRVDAADILVYDTTISKLAYPGRSRGFRKRTFDNSRARFDRALLGEVVHTHTTRLVRNVTKEKDLTTLASELAQEEFVGYAIVPLLVQDRLTGVIELFQRSSLNPNSAWLWTAEDLARQGALALGNVLWAGQQQQTKTQFAQAIDAIVEGWSNALELRDYEPKGHTQRVTTMAVDFARVLSIPEPELDHIRRGAFLHDVGKMGIPDEVLLKPDVLTDADWEIMRRHPAIAYEQLHAIEFLHPALDIPYCHHEKWDGTGYPRGLSREEIPLAARLFALVDVWDSLRSDRPYRKAWPEERVREYIRERSDKQFDPKLADLFLKLINAGLGIKRSGNSPAVPRNYLETTIHV
jgi:HD-GYP domain-containing protein (c-di-GMP phosphodiesterase class II)